MDSLGMHSLRGLAADRSGTVVHALHVRFSLKTLLAILGDASNRVDGERLLGHRNHNVTDLRRNASSNRGFRARSRVAAERIRGFNVADVPVIALAGFVVAAQHAAARDGQRQAVLEPVCRALDPAWNPPDDDFNEGILGEDMALRGPLSRTIRYRSGSRSRRREATSRRTADPNREGLPMWPELDRGFVWSIR
jgi:hypothetical protein